MRQQRRARAPARTPRRRRRRSPRSRARPAAVWIAGASPVSTSSSLTPRRAARSISRSTSSGSCRCGLCVANEQYLQWAAARPRERERDVARKSDPAHPFATIPVCVSRLSWSLACCSRVAAASSPPAQFGEVPLVLGDTPSADEAGVFLATARGYDDGRGRDAAARARRRRRLPPRRARRRTGCIAVLAIVRPDKLVLCADEVILQDERAEGARRRRARCRAATRRRSSSPTRPSRR